MFRITIAAVLSCAAMLAGCAADTTAPDLPAEQTDAPQAFEVRLRGDATAESATAAILAAGQEQLVTACEQTPGASVRIMNPLASGDYADVACSSILDGAGQTSEALTIGERIGEAQQPFTPIGGILCSLASLVATTAAANECKKWRGPNSEFCGVGGFMSGSAWIIGCYLAF
jgi:hypothetical protein